MLFKVDENLPIEAALSLQSAGHDAVTVQDQRMVGEPDPRLAHVCQLEGRALVTLDLDFADIRAYPPNDYRGLIVLRPRTQSKPLVVSLVTTILPLLTHEQLDGRLWIVQESGVRIRGG